MKISALIAEFNPFHRGHKLLVDSMRKQSDAVIAVMSGNFVQRGECAVFEKGERAKAAIENGVDLVLELPSVYALSSAEGFAKGGIKTLAACNIADELHFGSECGDIEKLSLCADILNEETPLFKSIISEKLKEGLSYPAARQQALQEIIPEGNLLSSPNNTLAIEYIREIKKSKLSIVPHTIKRMGSGYNDIEKDTAIPSASGIRHFLREGHCVKEHMLYNYVDKPLFMSAFDIIVAARLKAISKEELSSIYDCNSEIASRLKDASAYNTFEDIVSAASCKSYTQSRLRRILCNMITGNSFDEIPSPTYIRPVAFNEKGGEILKKMKSTASLPVASRGAVLKNDEIFSFECRCTDIYNLARGINGGMEFDRKVEII